MLIGLVSKLDVNPHPAKEADSKQAGCEIQPKKATKLQPLDTWHANWTCSSKLGVNPHPAIKADSKQAECEIQPKKHTKLSPSVNQLRSDPAQAAQIFHDA